MVKPEKKWPKLIKVEPDISTYQWFFDKLKDNWVLIVGTAGSGGVMTYLAAITEWLRPWGPGVCAIIPDFCASQ